MASRPAGLTHRVGTASDRSVWERIASGLGRAPVAAWLLLLVLAPLLLMVVYSVYRADDGIIVHDLNTDNYQSVVSNITYRTLLWRTVYTAAAAAALATLIALPMAYFVRFRLRRGKLIAVLLVIIPLWVSMLLRVFAWKVILGENGFLNSLLMNVGLTDAPSSAFLYTRFTVMMTLTYVAIPFVFIATYTALERIPSGLIEASQDSGASPWRTFRNVVWPLAKQGAAIGFGLALLLAVGDYITPQLVGGLNGTMLGAVIASQFGLVGNWPLGAAMAITLLFAVLAVLALVVWLSKVDGVLDSESDSGVDRGISRYETGRLPRLRALLAWCAFVLPYLILYLPLLVIVFFSFNDSDAQSLPLAGFTTRWYEGLWSNTAIIDALERTLLVGFLAVAIGAVAGTYFALVFARARTRSMTVVQTLMTLPVLLPGVVLGVALAITFRAIGLQFGLASVVLGHATFVTPVMMLVVLARLNRLDPHLAQASMDCGAGHVRTFWHVVLPQIRTALFGGALLGFTLSFDEVIVTFFLTGEQPTLPVYIWNQVRFGFTPEINAIFTIIGIGSLAIIVIASRILRSDLSGAQPGAVSSSA